MGSQGVRIGLDQTILKKVCRFFQVFSEKRARFDESCP